MLQFDSIQSYTHELHSNISNIHFIPTMGNLHQGHLNLVKQAQQKAGKNDKIIVSIFINPKQFAPNEDFKNYPRTLEQDSDKLKNLGVDGLFLPKIEDIYPTQTTQFHLEPIEIAQKYCGVSRPHFFSGVAIVVMKLFNIIKPQYAYFGNKDFQQLFIIKQMMNSFFMNVQIVGVETTREENGLAMSSRNNYLTQEQKIQASALFQSLQNAKKQIELGETNAQNIKKTAQEYLQANSFDLDYFEVCSRETLNLANFENDKNLVILTAANFHNVRLIDNIFINL